MLQWLVVQALVRLGVPAATAAAVATAVALLVGGCAAPDLTGGEIVLRGPSASSSKTQILTLPQAPPSSGTPVMGQSDLPVPQK